MKKRGRTDKGKQRGRRASRHCRSAITRTGPVSLVRYDRGLDASQGIFKLATPRPPASRGPTSGLGDRTDEATRSDQNIALIHGARTGCCRVGVRKVAQPDTPSAAGEVHPQFLMGQPWPWSAAARSCARRTAKRGMLMSAGRSRRKFA